MFLPIFAVLYHTNDSYCQFLLALIHVFTMFPGEADVIFYLTLTHSTRVLIGLVWFGVHLSTSLDNDCI